MQRVVSAMSGRHAVNPKGRKSIVPCLGSPAAFLPCNSTRYDVSSPDAEATTPMTLILSNDDVEKLLTSLPRCVVIEEKVGGRGWQIAEEIDFEKLPTLPELVVGRVDGPQSGRRRHLLHPQYRARLPVRRRRLRRLPQGEGERPRPRIADRLVHRGRTSLDVRWIIDHDLLLFEHDLSENRCHARVRRGRASACVESAARMSGSARARSPSTRLSSCRRRSGSSVSSARCR